MILVFAANREYPQSASTAALALLFVAFYSLCFAMVLFRPQQIVRLSSTAKISVLSAVTVILAASALLEGLTRENWYLYGVSSLAFLALAAGVGRIWMELRKGAYGTGLEHIAASAKYEVIP